MKAALESQLDGKLLRQRQTILQPDNRKTVCAVDGVLELIAAGDRSEFAETCFHADRSFAARRRDSEAGGGKIANRRNRRRGEALGKKQFGQSAQLISRAERRLRRVSRIRVTQVLFALDRKLKFVGDLHVGAGRDQI